MLKAVSSITNAIGALNYKGTWNASTNTPTLADGTGTKGDYYVVSTAGAQTFDSILLFFGAGDWIVYNGAVWQRVEGGSDGNFTNVTLNSTDTGATAAPTLDLYRNSASPAVSDTIGEIEFNGQDSAGNKQQYALIHGSILSPTSTTEQGQIHFETATAGALTEKMIIGTTNLVINEIGAIFNVRIEGDTDANLLYTDATNDRVGVGTISPSVKFEVSGAAKVTGTLSGGTSGTGYSFSGSAPATSLTLDASGNVGIGTSSPGARLDVVANDARFNLTSTGSGQTVGISIKGGAGGGDTFNFIESLNSGGTQAWYLGSNGTANTLAFKTNGNNERMRIDSSGNLLVGTTSFSFSDNGTKIASAGQIANCTNGDNNIELAGTGGARMRFYTSAGGAATTVGSISVSTVLTSYNTTSDYRLKTVVGAVTGHGARIDALKPIDYLWTEGGQQARGFLAHEFQEVYADSVTGKKDAVDADGKPVYQAMQASSSEVIADLVAEIQSLRKRLADAGIA